MTPLFNFALVWDTAIVYTFTKTEVCTESPNKATLLGLLIAWIYFAKLVKVIGYFRNQPLDFLLYFFPIPVYHIFAYFHSLLKLWTAITFWDCTWSGRSAESTEQGSENLSNGDNTQDKSEKQDELHPLTSSGPRHRRSGDKMRANTEYDCRTRFLANRPLRHVLSRANTKYACRTWLSTPAATTRTTATLRRLIARIGFGCSFLFHTRTTGV